MKISSANIADHLDTLYDAIVRRGVAWGACLPPSIWPATVLKCLVIEKGKGRSIWMQDTRNYLGFDPRPLVATF
jgi:thioredoxin reductase (NADPH)